MQITIREPGSAITHFIGMMMAVFASVPLLVKAEICSGKQGLHAMVVFMLSMILLYGASALYHTASVSEHVQKILRKIDHTMIYILIAGSYTPVCLLVLDHEKGYPLLALVWGLAAAGMVDRKSVV